VDFVSKTDREASNRIRLGSPSIRRWFRPDAACRARKRGG